MIFRMKKILDLRMNLLRIVRNPKNVHVKKMNIMQKYLKDLKGHKLAQHEGVKSSYNQCYIYSIF